jgi:hypothetical protein
VQLKGMHKMAMLRAGIMVLLLGSVTLLIATSVDAQEDETPRLGLIVTNRTASFRVSPQSTGGVLTTVPPNTRLYWVESQESGGYFRVVGLRGPSGWVSADDVQILRRAPSSAVMSALSEQTKVSCARTLSACPEIGCAKPGTPNALANEIKRRSPRESSPIPISFHDLVDLQRQALQRVGQGHLLSPNERTSLQNLSTASGSLGEGALVRISGFIGSGEPGPHPNSGESVNCNLGGAGNNDFHINVTALPSESQFAGIVVEMIPQERSPEWTIPKLQALQAERRRVLVTGPLFYDSFHIINQDPRQPLSGQPKRFSLWEIHRITGFYVCKGEGSNCDPARAEDWLSLEDFNP